MNLTDEDRENLQLLPDIEKQTLKTEEVMFHKYKKDHSMQDKLDTIKVIETEDIQEVLTAAIRDIETRILDFHRMKYDYSKFPEAFEKLTELKEYFK